jgi:hypothetical protein
VAIAIPADPPPTTMMSAVSRKCLLPLFLMGKSVVCRKGLRRYCGGMNDEQAMRGNAGERLGLLGSSFARLTGRALCAGDLWNAPLAVVAHDTANPPRFFYGNRLALDLFRMTAAQFIGLPSFNSAEPGLREERAQIFVKLEADDVVTGYSGVRIAADGTRFEIKDAVIWNLVDAHGQRHGQAAAIANWTIL